MKLEGMAFHKNTDKVRAMLWDTMPVGTLLIVRGQE
jgi:hypothetical protein